MKLMPQAPAAAEAGPSAGSTSVPSGCGATASALAGAAAGAAGTAVLQPESAQQIPNKHPGINLAFGMIVSRHYAGLGLASSLCVVP